MTGQLLNEIWRSRDIDQGDTYCPLAPETLHLCGFDFATILRFAHPHTIDLSNLHSLTLESCSGLCQAFASLVPDQDLGAESLANMNFRPKHFFIRQEIPCLSFQTNLEHFLCNIPGLTQLCVLLDGFPPQKLGEILKIQGKSLQSLVWDERQLARTETGMSHHHFTTPMGRLVKIAKYCRRLTALGIALDWQAINGSEKHHAKVPP